MLQYYNALPVSQIISISLEHSAVFRIPQSLVALLGLILLSLDLQGISYTVDCGCIVMEEQLHPFGSSDGVVVE